MRTNWMWFVLLSLAVSLVAFGCAEDEKDDNNNNMPPVNEGALSPTFEVGQSWTVAVSYRNQGVRNDENLVALTGEASDPRPFSEIFATAPSEVMPVEGELWSEPLYWTYGVINTAYIPEADTDFHQYALDQDGTAQPITIIKVVADKDLNIANISDTLDPVFYIVLRESDMRIRGIHYNYKVRDGRNTVVLEMPENDTGMPAPGSDQSFFLVPYLMPSFPMDSAASEDYTVEFAEGAQMVAPLGGDAVRTDFHLGFDGGSATQKWSAGSPWFDYSIAGDQRAWRLTPEQVTQLGGSSVASSVDFLEPAEAISSKFRNPINLRAVMHVQAGPISSSVPASHIPWSGDYWSLKGGSAIFGWESAARDRLDNGPGTALRTTILADMEEVDRTLADLREEEKDSDKYNELRTAYFEKKKANETTIGDHFDGLDAKYKDGTMTLTQEMLVNLGPLEKYDLYVIANKLQRSGYKNWGATKWHIENQWNPAGAGWWGHCNGWSAAAIQVNQPTEDLSVSLPLEHITGADEDLTLTFQPGDLKALASLSYYSGYSHFYGERYNGEEQDLEDIHAHVFHRILTYYIGTEKYPVVFDTTATEEVWNFPAYAYDGEIVLEDSFEPVEGHDEYTRAYRVTMVLTLGTDSVDEEYVALDIENQEVYTENYEYLLYTDDNDKVLGGKWISENHPDFAWVPYSNNTSFGWRSNENPQLIPSVLEQLYDLRENAPQVCDATANDGQGDCSGGLVCNAVNGTCIEGTVEPPTGAECAGGAARGESTPLAAGTHDSLSICTNRGSFFGVQLTAGDTLTATINFQHSDGDIDVSLFDLEGNKVAKSGSTTNQESVGVTATTDGIYVLEVFGYNGATNTVSVVIDVQQGMQTGCTEEANSANDDFENAQTISAGSFEGGICGADSDYFLVETAGTVTLAFTHALGDLDLAVVDSAGQVLNSSESTSDSETVEVEANSVIRVYGYDNAVGNYTLTVE